jgi:DNA-binding LytR/AlgR family response regulator
MTQPSTPFRCAVIDDDPVARSIVEHFIDETDDLVQVASFESATEALKSKELQSCQVLFLDVEMPKMNGLELLEALDDAPLVILVTSNPDYAVEAFGVDVIDYLLKPVTYGRFLKSAKRAISILQSPVEAPQESDHVFVKSDGKLMKVHLKEIEWIEAQRDYVLIHTAKKEYFIHSTMKRLTDRLHSAEFVRVHRSFIIRLDKVEDIQDSSVLIGRKMIPVGASFKDELLDRINLL